MDRRQFLGAAPLIAATPALANLVDETIAIQKEVDGIQKSGGGVLRIPGAYKISEPIRVHGNFGVRSIRIAGENAEIVSTHAGPAFEFDPSHPTPAPQYKQRSLIEGLSFFGPGMGVADSVGISIINGAAVSVRDCKVRSYEKGVAGVGGLILRFLEVELYNNAWGYHFTRTPTFAPNDVHFTSCYIFQNIRAGFAEKFPNGAITFNQCEIEGNNTNGNQDDGIVIMDFSDAGKVTLLGCHIELNPAGVANIRFAGGNASSALNLIGNEIIPGNRSRSAVLMASDFGPFGHLQVIGSRVLNGRKNDIYMEAGTSACIIGETSGGVYGDLSKVVMIKDGRIADAMGLR